MMHRTGERWYRLGRSGDGPPAARRRSLRGVVFLGLATLLGWAVCSSLGSHHASAQEPKGPEKVPGVKPPPEVGPPPKQLEGFPPGSVVLPRMGGPGPLGRLPTPTKAELEEYAKFFDKVYDPRNTFALVVDQHRILYLKQEPRRIQVGNEEIVDYNLLSPKEILIVGRKVGTTVLNFWFVDPKDKTKEIVLGYLVQVIPDPEAKRKLEAAYDALADDINGAFPDSFVKIKLLGDKLLVSGQAKDIAEGTQILRIIRANAPPDRSKIPLENVTMQVRPGDISAPGGLPGLDSFLNAGGPNVINMMRVPGEQQVMLKVTVAEVNRNAARSIGLSFSITNNQGLTVFANNTAGAAGGAQGGLAGAAAATIGNLPVLLDNGQIPLAITALKTLNYARSLAEPNLVTINGQPANFQVGGQFPVPIVTGFTGAGLQGVSFVPFGVQLAFTPFITDKDRIRLQIQANVSTRDPSIGSNFGGGAGGGGGGGIGQQGGGFVPGLNTRNFQTTVEMREGQTFAVAGLIQQNLGTDSSRVPFLGDIPLVGHLTGITKTSAGEQELVVLVSPELVHPMEPKQVPPLPGSDLFEPSDLEFYLLGRMESRRPMDYRSPVMTDAHRMIRYHRCEQVYMFGPNGYTPAAPPAVTPPGQ